MKSKKMDVLGTVSHVVFILLCMLTVLPLILVVVLSFTDITSVAEKGYSYFPIKTTLAAYEFIFQPGNTIFDSYKVTIFSTAVGTICGIVLTSMIAYSLSRKNYKFRAAISFYIFFTTIFNAGLIPTYITVTNTYHLRDSIWVLILPNMINCWHVILLRTFFRDVPDELVEAATIDGASEFQIFKDIFVPVAKGSIATVTLLLMLSFWNDWRTSMIYISSPSKQSLQYYLYRLITDAELLSQELLNTGVGDAKSIPTDAAKFAAAVVVMGPTIAVFPFFQKYFVRGITNGAVKG